jgi:hypothetical protein
MRELTLLIIALDQIVQPEVSGHARAHVWGSGRMGRAGRHLAGVPISLSELRVVFVAGVGVYVVAGSACLTASTLSVFTNDPEDLFAVF